MPLDQKKIEYERAVQNYQMAEQLWLGLARSEFQIVDKLALYEHLGAARDVFLVLKGGNFLSASNYLDKANLLYRALGVSEAQDGDTDKINSLKRKAQLRQFDDAVHALDRAKKVLSKMANGLREEGDKDFFIENLGEAKKLFKRLTGRDTHETLSVQAVAYLDVVQQVHARYENWNNYRKALQMLREADNLTAGHLLQKRNLYQEAGVLFSSLGNFFSAQSYAERAKQKREETFSPEQQLLYDRYQIAEDQRVSWNLRARHRVFMEVQSNQFKVKSPAALRPAPLTSDDKTPERPLTVLINGGDDVCLRPKLPLPSAELARTTIITPDGAFQLHATQKYYVAVLNKADLQKVGLGSLLEAAARRQRIPKWQRRKSIQAELAPEQLAALNASLVSGGGHAIEVPQSDRAQDALLPRPALRM